MLATEREYEMGCIDLGTKNINIWSGSEFIIFLEYKYCVSADVYCRIKVVLFSSYQTNTVDISEYIFLIKIQYIL